jgi:hypothetical protein
MQQLNREAGEQVILADVERLRAEAPKLVGQVTLSVF